MVRAHIQEAVRILGSQAKLAAACGVTQASIWQAMHVQRCSAELSMAIEQATAGAVKARTIRPDLPWPAANDPSDGTDFSEVAS